MDTEVEYMSPKDRGFPIAGFVRDIYEDAVIFIERSAFVAETHVQGRVLSVWSGREGYFNFVVLKEDGTQESFNYSPSTHCYFAIPEDTEDKFRGQK